MQPQEEPQDQVKATLQGAHPVSAMVLHSSNFAKELTANGKLAACRRSTLRFETSQLLAELPVKNGSRVQKGQTIARLDQRELRESYEQARISAETAKLEFRNVLIGQGYDVKDSVRIPQEMWDVSRLRSGYAAAEAELAKAARLLDAARLTAPFSGVVASLQYKQHDYVDAGKDFCTLIDDQGFEVSFSVIETELNAIALGKPVRVVPFSAQGESYEGAVSEINPIIDENGLVQVKAKLKPAKGLMEGMNVRVFVESEIPGQLVVPREAVVLRQNQQVLFKYSKGEAIWTYLNILHENSTQYAVMANPDKVAELQAGDTIIITNNLNLAHETKVQIKGKPIAAAR